MFKNMSKRTKNIIYYSLIAIFAITFIVCAILLADYFVESKKITNRYDDLSDLVNQMREDNATRPTRDDGSLIFDADESLPYDPNSPILPEYQLLYEMNNDLVGWIRIDGTVIDYPVMQTPNSKDYYLNRNFDKEYSRWGCVYVREQCDVFTPSDNLIIYGHYKQDGSMFHDLHGYYKKDYWQTHQYIKFDTIYERHTYQIVAVFKTSANLGAGYPYHQFNEAKTEEDFNTYIDTVKSLSFYDTGVTAEYGDMLITLSTCEYTQDNGRLVVVAKRIS